MMEKHNCNAYALRGPLLGAKSASILHGTLVGKRERESHGSHLSFVEES